MTPYQRHKHDWHDCQKCPLSQYRRNVVLVRGSLPADILFVGEAPGISEDALGKPFCGPAGKLLDKMIEQATPRGLTFAFTNVIACIPYDNEGKKVSEPTQWPEESIKECRPRLVEMVEVLATPKVVVTVGAVSGRQMAAQFPHREFRLVNITHPAAILRANPAQQGIMYQKVVVILSDLFESFIPF